MYETREQTLENLERLERIAPYPLYEMEYNKQIRDKTSLLSSSLGLLIITFTLWALSYFANHENSREVIRDRFEGYEITITDFHHRQFYIHSKERGTGLIGYDWDKDGKYDEIEFVPPMFPQDEPLRAYATLERIADMDRKVSKNK